MENDDDINMDEVLGPRKPYAGKPLSYEELVKSEAKMEQWWAEHEQWARGLSLLSLVVDAGTARAKQLWCFDPDVAPKRIWEPLTSGIVLAEGASADYPLPDSLTDAILDEAHRVWNDALNNPELLVDPAGETHFADDPYWLFRELETIGNIIDAIKQYGRQRLSLRFIADWGEQRYQLKQQLKELGL